MERPAAWELQGADALRRFQGLLLDRRGRLHGQVLRLREVARRLERLRRRSLAANVAGSSLSAAGAVTAIVGLSLSPVTLGVSLLASAVGLGMATAGGAVTITSDLSLIFCNSRELRRVQEIAATCQDQMREILSCLEFFCRWQGRGDRQLLQCGRNASVALYNSVYFIVFFGSRGFLIPRLGFEFLKMPVRGDTSCKTSLPEFLSKRIPESRANRPPLNLEEGSRPKRGPSR
nr:PREDICTED: apolipoprotein L domain-containing protein 1 isoform X2 [Equus przewalskii]XP_008521152.1 PREDICTED: apolipoprotein L domain-containing protein 1 isoform X2 [Equus przewalskii]